MLTALCDIDGLDSFRNGLRALADSNTEGEILKHTLLMSWFLFSTLFQHPWDLLSFRFPWIIELGNMYSLTDTATIPLSLPFDGLRLSTHTLIQDTEECQRWIYNVSGYCLRTSYFSGTFITIHFQVCCIYNHPYICVCVCVRTHMEKKY